MEQTRVCASAQHGCVRSRSWVERVRGFTENCIASTHVGLTAVQYNRSLYLPRLEARGHYSLGIIFQALNYSFSLLFFSLSLPPSLPPLSLSRALSLSLPLSLSLSFSLSFSLPIHLSLNLLYVYYKGGFDTKGEVWNGLQRVVRRDGSFQLPCGSFTCLSLSFAALQLQNFFKWINVCRKGVVKKNTTNKLQNKLIKVENQYISPTLQG